MKERVQIVLAAVEGMTNRQIAQPHHLEVHRVGTWRNRWHEHRERWKRLELEFRPKMSAKLVRQWLADAGGRGGRTTKIHAIVADETLPIVRHLSPGSAADDPDGQGV